MERLLIISFNPLPVKDTKSRVGSVSIMRTWQQTWRQESWRRSAGTLAVGLTSMGRMCSTKCRMGTGHCLPTPHSDASLTHLRLVATQYPIYNSASAEGHVRDACMHALHAPPSACRSNHANHSAINTASILRHSSSSSVFSRHLLASRFTLLLFAIGVQEEDETKSSSSSSSRKKKKKKNHRLRQQTCLTLAFVGWPPFTSALSIYCWALMS